MKKTTKSTMTWKEAPDTITPEDLSKILGIGIISARNIFDRKDFPKVSKYDIGNQGKADKEAARLYLQGFKTNEKSETSLLSLIYLELKKLNERLDYEKLGEEEKNNYGRFNKRNHC